MYLESFPTIDIFEQETKRVLKILTSSRKEPIRKLILTNPYHVISTYYNGFVDDKGNLTLNPAEKDVNPYQIALMRLDAKQLERIDNIRIEVLNEQYPIPES